MKFIDWVKNYIKTLIVKFLMEVILVMKDQCL